MLKKISRRDDFLRKDNYSLFNVHLQLALANYCLYERHHVTPLLRPFIEFSNQDIDAKISDVRVRGAAVSPHHT